MSTLGVNRLPPNKCLNCGHLLDAAGSLFTENSPSPGDVSICIECSHIMIYTNTLNIREPTRTELDEIVRNEDVFNTIRAIKKLATLDMAHKVEFFQKAEK